MTLPPLTGRCSDRNKTITLTINLVPLSRLIRSKTKFNPEWLALVFQRLAPVSCILFEFSLFVLIGQLITLKTALTPHNYYRAKKKPIKTFFGHFVHLVCTLIVLGEEDVGDTVTSPH